MADKDALRSMLNNFINDRQEEAQMDLHNYLSSKMKEVAGFSTPVDVTPEDPVDTDTPTE